MSFENVMLPDQFIPMHPDDDYPEDWHTFLYKAAKGSYEAVDIVMSAEMTYMIALTRDTNAPDDLPMESYYASLRQSFPASAPVRSLQELHDLAVERKWIAKPFRVSATPRYKPDRYVGLWGRWPISQSALMNDSMLFCLEEWSADHFIECVNNIDYSKYDSRMATTAMLYLSLTWPETPLST